MDGYMDPDSVSPGNASPAPDAAQPEKATRDQSTIQFPYMDLETAVEMAKVMRDRGGNTLFSKDQLAAAMGHAVTSGAFAAKIHAGRMFGLIDNPTPGRFRVTQLGFGAVDPDVTRAKAAKAEAFLKVPLYRKTYEEYRGKTLPSRPHGLERVFIEFGVRRAQARHKRAIGFRAVGEICRILRSRRRLPCCTDNHETAAPFGIDMPSPVSAPEREAPIRPMPAREVEHQPARHLLIEGLLQELPEPHTNWSVADRARWLRAAATAFDVLYIAENGDMVIVEAKTVSPRSERADGKGQQTDRS